LTHASSNINLIMSSVNLIGVTLKSLLSTSTQIPKSHCFYSDNDNWHNCEFDLAMLSAVVTNASHFYTMNQVNKCRELLPKVNSSFQLIGMSCVQNWEE
jgi:hypothetical protein